MQLIRSTHPYGYRSGQWAELLGVVTYRNRPCYVVIFNNDSAMDLWPVTDENDEYEFSESGVDFGAEND